MADLATLQAQLDELRAARGADKSVRVKGPDGEREAVYKSDAEIAAAIADLERRIAAMNGTRVRTFLPFTSKGL